MVEMNVSSVNCAAPQSNKTRKHVANGCFVGLATAGTAKVLVDGLRKNEKVYGDTIAAINEANRTGTKVVAPTFWQSKGYKFFEKLGEFLIPSDSKIGQIIKRFVTGETTSGGHMSDVGQIAEKIKSIKTGTAMVAAAGLSLLAVILTGIYNAGKINGNKQQTIYLNK